MLKKLSSIAINSIKYSFWTILVLPISLIILLLLDFFHIWDYLPTIDTFIIVARLFAICLIVWWTWLFYSLFVLVNRWREIDEKIIDVIEDLQQVKPLVEQAISRSRPENPKNDK